MSLTRKQFLSSMMGAVAGAAGVALLVGCSSSSSSSPDAAGGGGKDCAANGTTVTIGSNHGHVLVVAKADVTADVDKTYDIMGTADHTHSVVITAALFTTLKANTGVMVTSTVGAGHTHDISIGCL